MSAARQRPDFHGPKGLEIGLPQRGPTPKPHRDNPTSVGRDDLGPPCPGNNYHQGWLHGKRRQSPRRGRRPGGPPSPHPSRRNKRQRRRSLRRGGAYPKGTGSTNCSFFAGCRWRCSAHLLLGEKVSRPTAVTDEGATTTHAPKNAPSAGRDDLGPPYPGNNHHQYWLHGKRLQYLRRGGRLCPPHFASPSP